MEDKHKEAIRSIFISLVERTDLDSVVTSLYEKDVFSEPMIEPYRSMNHPSNEVKQLMARAASMLGRSAPLAASGPGAELLRALLPALVNGTKEKNTYVRANAEIALRAVLRLPHDEQFHLVHA
uniref:Uncharacterized protein n=1 Tax=Heliothis virescens TaxID=7102 RepID=A0A2A4IWR9_HELVI